MSSIQFGGRVSARLGSALNLVSEFAVVERRFTRDIGFHPAVGPIPKGRELSPLEKKLRDASLRYLLEGFKQVFGEINERVDSLEFSMWSYAANAFTNFVLNCTVEYGESERFDPDMPPCPVGRVLTELEEEVANAAMDFLIRGYTVTVSPALTQETERLLAKSWSEAAAEEPEGPRGG